MSGHFERKKQPPSAGKILLIVLVVIIVLLAALAIAVVIYYNSMLNKINHVDVPDIVYTQATTEATAATTAPTETTEATTVATTEPPHVPSSADYLNILLVGQASREGEEERFADTSILCTLNTYTKTMTMTSFLRDSFVKMPDYKGHYGGRIKLTTIYHLGSVYGDGPAGSMELMNMTLYNNFGVEVDHNFEVSFDAFIKVVDMLGGVDVELTEAEADYLNADDVWVLYDVEPGPAHLDGMAALCYARMRKAAGDNESDITRTSRQRQVIESLLEKVRQCSLSEIQNIANEVLPLVTTSMSNSEITELLMTLVPMLPELQIIDGGTCPANYQGDYVDIYGDGMQHSVLRFDESQTKKEMRAITEGEVSE